MRKNAVFSCYSLNHLEFFIRVLKDMTLNNHESEYDLICHNELKTVNSL